MQSGSCHERAVRHGRRWPAVEAVTLASAWRPAPPLAEAGAQPGGGDVGQRDASATAMTLTEESSEYHTWAEWLGVPKHTFSAVFGTVIARGRDYREVFQHFRPGFVLAAERQARLDAGIGKYLNGFDLYPDARPCLQALRDAGFFVGVAGNQTTQAGWFLRELNLPVRCPGYL